jgi:hypothetical protein
MDGSAIVGLIIAILMVVAHLVNSAKEAAAAKKQQQEPELELEFSEDELILISQPVVPPKPSKPKGNKQRQSSKNMRSILDNPFSGATLSEPPKKQALTKKLSPQGEGERFGVDPGTLDTARIVAPTFDPTVKPELESITGIYEQEATSMVGRMVPAVSLNIADYLTKPEGICHAVILAEILNRPAWETTFSRHSDSV